MKKKMCQQNKKSRLTIYSFPSLLPRPLVHLNTFFSAINCAVCASISFSSDTMSTYFWHFGSFFPFVRSSIIILVHVALVVLCSHICVEHILVNERHRVHTTHDTTFMNNKFIDVVVVCVSQGTRHMTHSTIVCVLWMTNWTQFVHIAGERRWCAMFEAATVAHSRLIVSNKHRAY